MRARDTREIEHFTKLPHVWWGLKTVAGQRRYENKFTTLAKMCHIREGSKILEVGCGNGEFTEQFLRLKTKGVKVIAVDLTPGLIKSAKRSIKSKHIEFKEDNLHSLSYPQNVFDIVCGISILHHVDLAQSLSEIYRVLKPGGEIFFTEPNMMNPVNFLGLHTPYLRERMEYSPDEIAFYRWPLERELRKQGFRNIRVLNYDFLYPKTPPPLISFVEKVGELAEKLPVIKEISGSLIIYAKK